MKISELEKREDFDALVEMGHRHRDALAEYQYMQATLASTLGISLRDVNQVAKQLDHWYAKYGNRLPSQVSSNE